MRRTGYERRGLGNAGGTVEARTRTTPYAAEIRGRIGCYQQRWQSGDREGDRGGRCEAVKGRRDRVCAWLEGLRRTSTRATLTRSRKLSPNLGSILLQNKTLGRDLSTGYL
jgi:hypothetical protein